MKEIKVGNYLRLNNYKGVWRVISTSISGGHLRVIDTECLCVINIVNHSSNIKEIVEYETVPKDYTGCHPVIADHLKRGLKIKCNVYDTRERNYGHTAWITSYFEESQHPYGGSPGLWRYAEPIEIQEKKRTLTIKWPNGHEKEVTLSEESYQELAKSMNIESRDEDVLKDHFGMEG